MPSPGFIDQVGIGVPDLVPTKEYYETSCPFSDSESGSRPAPADRSTTGRTALEAPSCSSTKQKSRAPTRSQTGLHHLAFLVASRAVVREAYEWARTRGAVILDEPAEFPQYGAHCYATYWLDPHGFKLEVVCHTPEES